MVAKRRKKSGNLLVIDDEPEVLKSLKRQFRKRYNIYLANDAAEGYQIMGEHTIHVIISDQRMPDMTGTEFFKLIKAEFPDAIRLILTAYADIELVIAAVNDGNVFHYLTKPWIPAELEAVVDKAFKQYWLIYGNKKLLIELKETNEILKREIAERKRSEIAKEAAEATSQAKTAFLANMSHELRTPLNAILGFAQLTMQSYPLTPEQFENINIIYRSGEHLLTLINQVLDLSKIELGRAALNPTAFDLYHLINELQELFQLKANHKALHFHVDYEIDVPQYIYGDEVKLRQVLLNLLSNAFKFTKTGSIKLLIKNYSLQKADTKALKIKEPFLETSYAKKISSSIRPQQLELHFSVIDTGPGIAPNEINQLFEAFVQTETGRQSEEGTGLGLSISQKFVELMGGNLTVNSVVGYGTTFNFTIQCEPTDPITPPISKLKSRVIALQPNQPTYRILVVDDKWSNRQLLVKLLQPLGFDLKEAEDGQEAVEIWRTWHPHLIWMDMRMPVMDGYSAIKIIKTPSTSKPQAKTQEASFQKQVTPENKYPTLSKVIALTASTFEEKQEAMLALGCDGFLRKPFKDAEVFELLNQHIGVQYVYDTEPISHGMINKDNLTLERIAKLPIEWQAKMEHAILSIDIDQMYTLIEQLDDLILAKALKWQIANFEYKEILTLIQASKE